MPVFACALVTTTRIAGCRNTTLHQLTPLLLAAHVSILCLPHHPARHLPHYKHHTHSAGLFRIFRLVWTPDVHIHRYHKTSGCTERSVVQCMGNTARRRVFLQLFCYYAGLEFLRLYETKRQINWRCMSVVSIEAITSSETSLTIRRSTRRHIPKDLKFHSLVQITHPCKLESVLTWTSHLWLGLSNCLCP